MVESLVFTPSLKYPEPLNEKISDTNSNSSFLHDLLEDIKKPINSSAKQHFKISDYASDNIVEVVTPLTYRYAFRAYLKDSNAVGNIYFATYFEWQGVCREAFFLDCVSKNLMELGGMFITKRAENSYLAPLMPFDEITCSVNTRNIKRASLDLSFKFYKVDSDLLVATGSQTLAFFNKENRAIRIPLDILNTLARYEG